MLYVLIIAFFVFARATTVPYCLNNKDVLRVTRYAEPLVAHANVDFFGGTVCQTGEVCDNNLCVPYDCSPDCPAGEICKNKMCRSVPSKLLEGHTACALRCGPRELCANGVCTPISRLRYKCKGDNCDVPTNNELCSILDNLSNPTSYDNDEGSGITYGNPKCGSDLSGIGECAFGRLECVNGIPQCVGAVLPSPERCDGLDNDCDGLTDEDFVLGQTCTVGVGLCKRTGVTICNNAHDGTTCSVVPGAPSAETCDGFDNDCDGQIDEDFNVGQICTIGVGACQSTGQFVCKTDTTGTECNATIVPPGIETCNGIDDDCDGFVDNGFNINDTCTVGVGACARTGRKVCSQDGTTTVCNVSPGTPVPEVCDDGIDNDCDGHIDSADPSCSEDECNDGLDNNNDGLFDCDDPDCNGAVRDCYFGPTGTEGVGICTSGTETCDGAGTWSACTDVRPAPETCDGIDNDCDGVVDNIPPAILSSDEDNCGSCGNVCPTDGLCIQSSCRDCHLVTWTYSDNSGSTGNDGSTGSSSGDETFSPGGDSGGSGGASTTDPDGETAGSTIGTKFTAIELSNDANVAIAKTLFLEVVLDNLTNASPCGVNPGYKSATLAYNTNSSISETFTIPRCSPLTLENLDTYLLNDFGSATIQQVLNDTSVTIQCYADAGCLDVPCAADSCGNSGSTGVQTCINNLPVCEQYINNTANCGACNDPCGAGQTCDFTDCICNDPTLTLCSGVCVDTTTDPQFCGGCDNLCPVDSGCCASGCYALGPCGSDAGECSSGTNQCINGQVTCVGEVGPVSEVCDGLDNDCDGVVDNVSPAILVDDNSNCGACGNACASGETCESGVCVATPVSCPSGLSFVTASYEHYGTHTHLMPNDAVNAVLKAVGGGGIGCDYCTTIIGGSSRQITSGLGGAGRSIYNFTLGNVNNQTFFVVVPKGAYKDMSTSECFVAEDFILYNATGSPVEIIRAVGGSNGEPCLSGDIAFQRQGGNGSIGIPGGKLSTPSSGELLPQGGIAGPSPFFEGGGGGSNYILAISTASSTQIGGAGPIMPDGTQFFSLNNVVSASLNIYQSSGGSSGYGNGTRIGNTGADLHKPGTFGFGWGTHSHLSLSSSAGPGFASFVYCSKCGNGIVDPGEQCDDPNAASGDGCSSTCEIEPGYECPSTNGCCLIGQRITVCPAGRCGLISDNCGGTLDCGPADDGNACNGLEFCTSFGTINNTPPPNCDDGLECTIDSCNVTSGCAHVNVPDNTPCSTGVCISGQCTNTCTVNSDCVGNEVCVLGQCQCILGCPVTPSLVLTACPGNPCIDCRDLNNDVSNCGSCGNVCGANETCTSGVCVAPPVPCSSIDVTYSTVGTFEHPLPADAKDITILEAVGGGGGGQRALNSASYQISDGCGGAAQSYFNVSLGNLGGQTLRFVIPDGGIATATARPDGGDLDVCKLPCGVGDALLHAAGGKTSLGGAQNLVATNGGDGAVGRNGGVVGGAAPQNGIQTSSTQFEGAGGGAGGSGNTGVVAQRGGSGAVPPGYPPQVSPDARGILTCSGGSSSYGSGGGLSSTGMIIPAGFGAGGGRGPMTSSFSADGARGGRGKARLTYCSLCGNGVLDAGEQCDDGNAINGDNCNSACQIEV